MLFFLIIGGAGVLVLLLALLVDDFVEGVMDFDFGDGFFSGPAIGAFLSAFGFGGAIATGAGLGTLPATGVGVGAGMVVGGLAGMLTRTMMHMPTDGTVKPADFAGETGVVVTAIPVNGVGEVSVRLGGVPHKLGARSSSGALEPGSGIVVVEALSPTMVLVRNSTGETQ